MSWSRHLESRLANATAHNAMLADRIRELEAQLAATKHEFEMLAAQMRQAAANLNDAGKRIRELQDNQERVIEAVKLAEATYHADRIEDAFREAVELTDEAWKANDAVDVEGMWRHSGARKAIQ